VRCSLCQALRFAVCRFCVRGLALGFCLRGPGRDGERLYRHRFEGPIDSLLKTYKATRGKGELKLQFTVTDLSGASAEGAD
jgi:hypothetical protein